MRKFVMLAFILIFTVLCAPCIQGQKYLVTDSSCPVEQTGYNSYLIKVVMSPTSNSIKCKLPLRPAITGSRNMYALVKILNSNCAAKLKRPISAYTTLDSFNIDCNAKQLPYQTLQVTSNNRIDIEFPASSYDYQLRLSILVMYYTASSRCSAYDIPCTGSGILCVLPSDICDGKSACPSSQDEPAICDSSNMATSTVPTTTPSNVIDVVVNWFMADPVLRITIAAVGAVGVFFVLPTVIFCCCGKKKRKPVPRSSRASSRSRSARDREANVAVSQGNQSRRAGRPSGRGNTRQASGSRSGTSHQGALNRYEPVRSEPSAPPPPLSSAPPMPSAPLVLLPAGNQPLYAVPFAQTGGQPAYFGQPMVGAPGGPEQPQYVTAYMLQQGGATVPFLLGSTAGQPPQHLLLAGQPPIAAAPITNTRETCAPPTYDEAIRAPAPASPAVTVGQSLANPFAGVQTQTPLSNSTTTNQPVGSAVQMQTRFMPGSEQTQPNLNQPQQLSNANTSLLDTTGISNAKAIELVPDATAHEAQVNLLPRLTSEDQRSHTDCEAEEDADSASSTGQQMDNRNFENQAD